MRKVGMLLILFILAFALPVGADEVWNFFGPQVPFPNPTTVPPGVAIGSGPVTVTNVDGFKVTLTPYSSAPTPSSVGTIGQLVGKNYGFASDEQGVGVGARPYTNPPSTSTEVNGNEAIRIDFIDWDIIPGAASQHLFFNSLAPEGANIEIAHVWQDCVGCISLGTVIHDSTIFPAPDHFEVPSSAFNHPIFVKADTYDFLLYGVSIDTITVTGCTLTLGYWKTHSIFGPASPSNPTWNDLPNGPSTLFFSGKTWLQVLQTPPRGNAYYILAQQYIAAVLNVLNGAATTPTVEAALIEASSFFSNPFNTPNKILSTTQRNRLILLGNILDQYNNGIVGPGHCG